MNPDELNTFTKEVEYETVKLIIEEIREQLISAAKKMNYASTHIPEDYDNQLFYLRGAMDYMTGVLQQMKYAKEASK